MTTIEFGGLFRCIRIHEHDGVDRGAILIVKLDAFQVLIHETPAGEAARFHRAMHLADSGLYHIERRGGLGGKCGGAHQRKSKSK